MQARAFNTILIIKEQKLLIKSSTNIDKIKDEVNYYLNLPSSIARFFPQIINFQNNFKSYTIKYIPCEDLSHLILTNKISSKQSKVVLGKLFNILKLIHSHKPPPQYQAEKIKKFYINKTLSRIEALKSDKNLSPLVNCAEIKINGEVYKSFKILEKEFINEIDTFVKKYPTLTIIHGDFCFGNILYCPITSHIKLIDPRGSFGKPGIYGHFFYDYAKLLHCIHGGYDQIVTNKYYLNKEEGAFTFKKMNVPILNFLHQTFRQLCHKNGIELPIIYLIEASLFLSMAVLHYEDPQRQKALYLNGIIILNEYFEEKYAYLH